MPAASNASILVVLAASSIACRADDPGLGVQTAEAANAVPTPSSDATAAASASAPPRAAPPPAGMVEIPPGYFLMGGESPENTPVHEAVVAKIWLDEKEVTTEAYGACVSEGKCKPPRVDNPFCNAPFPDRKDHPANCIDHNDATAFCERAGKRLPTETEWEYAARGGAEQRLYSWGNEEPDRQRACYMHEGGSCSVGAHPAGAFGLYDMTGNVWEWTSSWYAPYPAEASEGFYRVYRGGSWSRRFAKWMRNDLRNRYRPEEQSASVGFRCAKDVTPTECPPGATAKGTKCVRTSGTPLCPKGEQYVQGACWAAGIVPAHAAAGAASGRLPTAASGEAAALPTATASAAPVALSRSRAPGFDADCARISPGLPVAYSFSGGSFHDREPMVRASGCKKRDVGVGWTSACCAN